MMKGFEHSGFWWDPRDPGTKWPGTLTFDPVTGASLKLTVTFTPAQLFGESREFDVIHGETAGSLPVTLLHCFERGASEMFANAVIVGFHADQPDPPIAVAAAVIENLKEWWGQNALSHDPLLTFPNIGVRYTQPEATEVDDDAIIRTTIHSSPLASFERTSVSVEEEIRIEMTASEARPLSAFRQRIHACQDLLSIASLTLCNVEELRLVPPSDDGKHKVVGRFYAVPVFKNPAEGWPDFLFRHKDIAPRVREVFSAWLNNAERLSAVRSLYMSAAYGKSFLELRLLAFAQAAEAYHRRMYEGQDLYMDAGTYERNILPGLQAAIPESLGSSHAQALRNRLKYGNQISFPRRLRTLFKEHEAALATVIPNPCGWVERIVDYRNDLTHHPVVDDRSDVDKIGLIRCNWVLRILLDLCFLKSMAIDAEGIKQLAEGCERYRQIKQRFFRAPVSS